MDIAKPWILNCFSFDLNVYDKFGIKPVLAVRGAASGVDHDAAPLSFKIGCRMRMTADPEVDIGQQPIQMRGKSCRRQVIQILRRQPLNGWYMVADDDGFAVKFLFQLFLQPGDTEIVPPDFLERCHAALVCKNILAVQGRARNWVC